MTEYLRLKPLTGRMLSTSLPTTSAPRRLLKGLMLRRLPVLMDGRSCAELETVINEAGLYAGYERAELYHDGALYGGLLETVFDVPASLDDYDDDDLYTLLSDSNNVVSQIVYHEAGHAVVSEILCPESVNLISAHNRGGAERRFHGLLQ